MSKSVVEHIVKSLVEVQNSVSVEQEVNDGKIAVKIFVAEQDLGRVIGKSGRTIRALRSMVQVISGQDDCYVTVEAQPNQ